MLTAHGVSHPGRVRSKNEDVWLSALDLGLFIVADGMGGQNAGEIASSLAVDAIRSFVARTRQGDAVAWPFGEDPVLSHGANRVLTALKLANERVFKSGESEEQQNGMGTTAVVVLIEQSRLIYAGVGDSRIYSSYRRRAATTDQRRFMGLSNPGASTGREPGIVARASDAERPHESHRP